MRPGHPKQLDLVEELEEQHVQDTLSWGLEEELGRAYLFASVVPLLGNDAAHQYARGARGRRGTRNIPCQWFLETR